jgi:hypothetical protein
MPIFRQLSVVAALLALSLLAAACNGGSDDASPAPGSPTPTTAGDATATPSPGADGGVTPAASPAPGDADLLAALALMVIQEEDLPEGIQLVSRGYSTNEDLIEASADPDAKRAELTATGRVLGYSVTFQPGPDVIADTPIRGVDGSVSLYETEAGAAQSLAQAMIDANATDWQAANPDLQDLQVRTVGLAGVADELLWLRVSGVSASPPGIVVDDNILFRSGRGRGFLRVLATAPDGDRDLLIDEVEGWLRAQVQRVAERLAAGVGD